MAIEDQEAEPELLYYYCTSSTFLSIIKNSALWLTSISLSNDRMEGNWAIDLYLGLFKSADRSGFVGARAMLQGMIDSRVALGMCFSSERDLLSQWRGYADGGRGICIAFDVNRLKASIALQREAFPKLRLRKVSYARTLAPETVKEIRGEFGAQIEQARMSGEGGHISMSKNYENGGHDRETSVISGFFTIKNPAFKEEQEWRLLLVDYPSSVKALKFRQSNGLISPYIEIPIELGVISSVSLGPLHPTPERDIERLLKSSGVAIPVRKSTATYVVR